MTKVTSIEQLRNLIMEKNYHDFFICLRGGLRSSKNMDVCDNGKRFWVFNEIDGTDEDFSEEELMNRNLTNIGYAIRTGVFYCYD